MKKTPAECGEILSILEKSYPDARCGLEFISPFTLLVSTVLSAQCTDKRVNKTGEVLFREASTPEEFAAMPLERLEELIRPCGFYRNKAKAIRSLSEDILARFGGRVPDTVEDLMTLRGVGRKTASVVYSEAFGGEAVPVDTHVFRTSRRLGLSEGRTPDEVMEDLMREFPPSRWNSLHHTLISHGRTICRSRNPGCGICPLNEHCGFYKERDVQNS